MASTEPETQTQQLTADILLLAAGFGSRLMPLTEHTPKPLIQIHGKTLLEWNLDLITRSGFSRVIINLHYLGDKIRKYLSQLNPPGLEVVFVEEPEILGTGGAIRNIEPLMRTETVITINSDILIDGKFSLQELLRAQLEHADNPLATLVLHSAENSENYSELGVDASGRIVRFIGKDYLPGLSQGGLVYTGIQAISRRIFELMPARGSIFSITEDTYAKALRNSEWLNSLIFQDFWSDLGTPERLEKSSPH